MVEKAERFVCVCLAEVSVEDGASCVSAEVLFIALLLCSSRVHCAAVLMILLLLCPNNLILFAVTSTKETFAFAQRQLEGLIRNYRVTERTTAEKIKETPI